MKKAKVKSIVNEFEYPQSRDALEKLIENVIETNGFEDDHHAAALICGALMRLPQPEPKKTMTFLGDTVRRHITWTLAQHKQKELAFEGHVAFVNSLKDLLMTDPNNQEAVDELQKLANQGSAEAKIVLAEFDKSLDTAAQTM